MGSYKLNLSSPKSNILAVDDNPASLNVLTDILSPIANVYTATNGEDALKRIEELNPALVISDIQMPGIDGYEVCRRIKANEKFNLTKIILVSSNALISERLRGYEAGADDYIGKPYDISELSAKFHVLLRLFKAEMDLYTLNQELEKKIEIRTQQLLTSEKMAFIGIHTAEIVHNLNNPFAILKGSVQVLASKFPVQEDVERVMRAINRIQDIIRTILETSRLVSDQSVRELALNHILKSELELFKNDSFFKHQVRVELELSELPSFRGRPSDFSQSFNNLIKNAIDAMYGRLEKKLRVVSKYKDNKIEISITDTGCGIPKENLSKLFDPFFTTKSLVQKGDEPMGTGLGLSSVKHMIEAYGGNLQFETEVGKGTTVTISLPLRSF